jgi:hypothetical protein
VACEPDNQCVGQRKAIEKTAEVSTRKGLRSTLPIHPPLLQKAVQQMLS